MRSTTLLLAAGMLLGACQNSEIPTSPKAGAPPLLQLTDVVNDGATTALEFDGVDDYVDLGTGPSFRTHTIEAWVRISSAIAGNGGIFGQVGAEPNGCYQGTSLAAVVIPAGFYFSYDVGPAGCRNDQVVESAPSSFDSWHYVAGTWDGSIMRLYVDGGLAGSRYAPVFDAFDHMQIGTFWDNFAGHPIEGFLKGDVNEVRLWDRARTEAEIVLDMCGDTGAGAQPGLIGYWPLNDGKGQVALDGSTGLPAGGSPSGSVPVGAGVLGANADRAGDPADPEWFSTVGHRCRTPQAITITSTPPIPAYVGSAYVVTATGGGSGNPVVLSSLTPSICGVAGNTASLLAVGTCTLALNQAGNADYSAAPQVTQSFLASYPVALTKEQCMNEGWLSVTRGDGSVFKTQGDCIQFVNTGK